MKQLSTEKFIEKMKCDVYPITLVKFLLNRRRILSYFERAADPSFNIRIKYTTDYANCDICKEKASEGMLCRQHTSIERVLKTNNILFDLDTNVYFYKNEIFRMVGGRLVIVYCPHPKLISGEITDSKVRKINPITVEDINLTELPSYEKISEFISSGLMDQHMKCWFNSEFSIVTIPEDRNKSNWCLVANK